jgi:hypothetical protein
MFTVPIAADFSDDIAVIAEEVYGSDSRKHRRRIYYLLSEVPAEDRPAGLFKIGGKACMMRSVLRADLERRALAAAIPAAINQP